MTTPAFDTQGPGPTDPLAPLRARIATLYKYRDQAAQDTREGVPVADTQDALRQLGFHSVQDLENRINALNRVAPGRAERAGQSLNAFSTGGEQGLTFGFSDELEGKGLWPQGVDAGTDPTAAARSRLAVAKRDHPVAEMAGEVGGTVVPMLATGLASGALQSMGLQGLIRRMLLGATLGAGEAEAGAIGRGRGSLADRVSDAGVMPAVSGAATGLAIPPIGSTAESVIDPHVPVSAPTAARRMVQAVPKTTLASAPDELRTLRAAIPAGGDNPIVAADTRAGQALAEGAATADPAGAGQILAPLAQRGPQAAPIMERVISALTGQGTRQSATEIEAAQRALRSATGRQMYGVLESYVPPDPVAYSNKGMSIVNSLTDSPDFPRIWAQAQRNAQNLGYKLQPIVTRSDRGLTVTGEAPDFITLQTMHEVMRDIVSTGFKPGASASARSTARALAGRVDALQQGIKDMFGADYEAAQSSWRNATAGVDATRRATSLLNQSTNVRDAQNWLRSVAPEAQAVHQQAGIEDAIFRLGNAKNPARMWSEWPTAKKQLLFSPQQMQEIDATVGSLRRMSEMGTLLGGSRTANRQATVAAMGLGTAPRATRTVLGTVWDALQPKGMTASQLRGARYMAEQLMKPDFDPNVFRSTVPFAKSAVAQTPVTSALIPSFWPRRNRATSSTGQ